MHHSFPLKQSAITPVAIGGRIKNKISGHLKGIRINSLKYAFRDPAGTQIKIDCPQYYNEPNEEELPIVSRIFQAFKKMKADQLKAGSLYRPSSLWQTHLDEAYRYLKEGVETDDIRKFHFFLSNFGAWRVNTGIENNDFIKRCTEIFLGERYLRNEYFWKSLNYWNEFYGARKPIQDLSYPRFGNQAGAIAGDTFIGLGSFFSEIYGSLLSQLLIKSDRPVIADLGGGFGKLGYFITKKLKTFSFIDFDLPEVLCLAAYFLMLAYPDKKALLYGESEFSSQSLREFDLIFMPSFEIEKLEAVSVDLFVNKNSLGEMDPEAAKNYVAHISRATKYFFHINHEHVRNVYSGNQKGLLAFEYPVPMDEFDLLWRQPDLGHLNYKDKFNGIIDIYVYLYRRANSR